MGESTSEQVAAAKVIFFALIIFYEVEGLIAFFIELFYNDKNSILKTSKLSFLDTEAKNCLKNPLTAFIIKF